MYGRFPKISQQPLINSEYTLIESYCMDDIDSVQLPEGKCQFPTPAIESHERAYKTLFIDGMTLSIPVLNFECKNFLGGGSGSAYDLALRYLEVSLKPFDMEPKDLEKEMKFIPHDEGVAVKIYSTPYIASRLSQHIRYGKYPPPSASESPISAILQNEIDIISKECENAWKKGISDKEITVDHLPLNNFPASTLNASEEEFFRCMDAWHNGDSYILGAIDIMAKMFLEKNIEWLYGRGYKTIYIKTVPQEAQPLLDDYLQTNNPIDKRLEFLLKSADLFNIVDNAKRFGMRVVAIDSPFNGNSLAAFNYSAARAIENDADKREGSYIIFVNSENAKYNPDTSNTVANGKPACVGLGPAFDLKVLDMHHCGNSFQNPSPYSMLLACEMAAPCYASIPESYIPSPYPRSDTRDGVFPIKHSYADVVLGIDMRGNYNCAAYKLSQEPTPFDKIV
jgi:hypothetical protein